MSLSIERLKQLQDLAQRMVNKDHVDYKDLIWAPAEILDLVNDALSWRKHCGPPLACEGKPHGQL